MKYLIPIVKFVVIYDNEIENKTSYNSQNNIYNMNPIIAYKETNLNAYYIEIKFEKYNNYTRLSLDKNDKILLKIIDNILFINNKKIFVYTNNKYLKLVLNYNEKTKNTEVYLFNELPYIREWEKIIVVNNKINFYQKFLKASIMILILMKKL